jgi:hypothetical protein
MAQMKTVKENLEARFVNQIMRIIGECIPLGNTIEDWEAF